MIDLNNSARYADQLLLKTAQLYHADLRQAIIRGVDGHAARRLDDLIKQLHAHPAFKEKYGTTLQDRLAHVKESLEKDAFKPEDLKPLESYLKRVCW